MDKATRIHHQQERNGPEQKFDTASSLSAQLSARNQPDSKLEGIAEPSGPEQARA